MLRQIIDALEERANSISSERDKDLARRDVLVPALVEITNVLAGLVDQVQKEASSPEMAYTALREGVVELHEKLTEKATSYQNVQHIWSGRQAELLDILRDLKTIADKSEETPVPPPSSETVTVTADPEVRQRPRKVGEKPVSLRSQRNRE